MSVLPIGSLTAPDTSKTSSTSSIAEPHHKRGVSSLKDGFQLAASNALSTIGSATVAVSSNVQAALNNLKPSV